MQPGIFRDPRRSGHFQRSLLSSGVFAGVDVHRSDAGATGSAHRRLVLDFDRTRGVAEPGGLSGLGSIHCLVAGVTL